MTNLCHLWHIDLEQLMYDLPTMPTLQLGYMG